MGDYRYHELRPLMSYFPCHWIVPVDFPNICPMKIVRIFYRIYFKSHLMLTRVKRVKLDVLLLAKSVVIRFKGKGYT